MFSYLSLLESSSTLPLLSWQANRPSPYARHKHGTEWAEWWNLLSNFYRQNGLGFITQPEILYEMKDRMDISYIDIMIIIFYFIQSSNIKIFSSMHLISREHPSSQKYFFSLQQIDIIRLRSTTRIRHHEPSGKNLKLPGVTLASLFSLNI